MSQFPNQNKRRRPPVKGAYVDSDYSPWMRINERDVASVAANTATATPIFAVASAVESLAFAVDPGASMTMGGLGSLSTTFFATWLLQTVCYAVLKTIACLLRDRGESWVRNVTAWFWKWVIAQAWESLRFTFFGWLPFGGRVVKPFPAPLPDKTPKSRKRIIDRIIPWREKK